MNDLLTRLHMEPISDWFDTCYQRALEEEALPDWLTERYLRDAAASFPYFTDRLEDVISALPAVCENPDLVLFAKTLYHMLSDNRHHEQVFPGLEFPKAPEGAETLGYDIFSFYPVFARIHEVCSELRKKDIDQEIIRITYSGIDGCINSSIKLMGRLGFTKIYFLWCTGYKNAALFRLDRFTFEIRDGIELDVYAFVNKDRQIKLLMKDGLKIHKNGLILGSAGAKDPEGAFQTTYQETETAYEGHSVDQDTVLVQRERTRLDKAEWELLYKPGDDLVSIHIPGKQPFDREFVESSLNHGREFFKKLYPDRALRAFMCISWLLSPRLKKFLKPTSNILDFQNRYTRFPYPCEGLPVFQFVFELGVSSLEEVDLDALPETTSVQRNIKRIYQDGGYILETGGLFLF